MDLHQVFTYPYDNDFLLRKRKAIRRGLKERVGINYIG